MTIQAVADFGRPARMDPLLRMAVLQGGAGLVHVHIRRGVNLEACDEKGLTPLMLAAAKGHLDVCRLLIDAGALVDATDFQGCSVLDHASQARNPALVDLLSDLLQPHQPAPPMPSGPPAAASPLPDNIEEEDDDSGWVAIPEPVRPVQDEQALRRACAADLDLSLHRAKAGGADWTDVPLSLPTSIGANAKASLGPLDDGELRESVERILLHALRDGRAREEELSSTLRGGAGLEVAAALRAALRIALGDLGVLPDAAGDFRDRPDDRELSGAERHEVDEALAFIASLLCDCLEEPERFRKEYTRSALLDREDEAVLARRLRNGVDEALAIVARSDAMLAVVMETGRQVANGRIPLSTFVDWAEEPSAAEVDDDEADGSPEGEAAPDGIEETLRILPADFVSVFQEIATIHGRMRAVGGASADPGLARSMKRALRALDPSPVFLAELAALRPSVQRERRLVEEFRLSLERVASARGRFVTANLRLVAWVAKRYRSPGQEHADLMQEGCKGLIRACEKFDPDRGAKFATYAIWWIRQAITRAIADHSRLIRLPVHVFEKHRRIQRLVRAGLDTGTTTAGDVAKAIGVEELVARRLLRVHDDVISLEAIPPAVLETSMDVDSPAPDPEETAIQAAMRRTLLSMVADLPRREATVIRLRFGLGGGKEHTLEEVGRMFDVTRERIRQIEMKALKKLRHPGRCKRLKDFP